MPAFGGTTSLAAGLTSRGGGVDRVGVVHPLAGGVADFVPGTGEIDP